MAKKEFWDELIKDVEEMSDEDFLAFVEEYDNVPDIAIIIPELNNMYNFESITSDSIVDVSYTFGVSEVDVAVYEDFDWACVA